MKDYASMSDFEINKAVAVATGYHPDECDIAKLNNSLVGVEWDDETGYATKTFDFCNNPADAWPIIVSNQISLMYEEATGKWCAGKPYWVDGCEWQLDNDVMDGNPLRAAMVVFLMMKEKEND